MANKKKIENEKLADFFDEVNQLKKEGNDSNDNNLDEKQSGSLPKPYQCPSCHQSLSSRKEPCKHCGYKGYIPMGDDEIKKTRIVLFVIILVIAIVVYVLTRR